MTWLGSLYLGHALGVPKSKIRADGPVRALLSMAVVMVLLGLAPTTARAQTGDGAQDDGEPVTLDLSIKPSACVEEDRVSSSNDIVVCARKRTSDDKDRYPRLPGDRPASIMAGPDTYVSAVSGSSCMRGNTMSCPQARIKIVSVKNGEVHLGPR